MEVAIKFYPYELSVHCTLNNFAVRGILHRLGECPDSMYTRVSWLDPTVALKCMATYRSQKIIVLLIII
jgi:hypothetical protein